MARYQPIFVTGIGRCGSSAVAGVLHHLGVLMARCFQAADPHNPWGYFEDADLAVLQEAYLQGHCAYAECVTGMDEFFELLSATGMPWGVKSPRLCYFMPYLRARFPEARWVICMRENPLAVSASFQATYGLTEDEAQVVILSRLTRLVEGCVNLDYHAVEYEVLCAEPSRVIAELAAVLGLSPTMAQVAQAIQHIHPVQAVNRGRAVHQGEGHGIVVVTP